jgi:hypothetical protein
MVDGEPAHERPHKQRDTGHQDSDSTEKVNHPGLYAEEHAVKSSSRNVVGLRGGLAADALL